ncbi:hypothetical protein LCGC14_1033980 [marine sediment metagenome]|uniref:Uncharacterized protein n=1 Tax=marine sediment metagenome TaxID=412755 RepID=A0A0F9MTS0_9ZZZZ
MKHYCQNSNNANCCIHIRKVNCVAKFDAMKKSIPILRFDFYVNCIRIASEQIIDYLTSKTPTSSISLRPQTSYRVHNSRFNTLVTDGQHRYP